MDRTDLMQSPPTPTLTGCMGDSGLGSDGFSFAGARLVHETQSPNPDSYTPVHTLHALESPAG